MSKRKRINDGDGDVDEKRHRGVERVCVVGSGNWGSAVAKIVGTNVMGRNEKFVSEVRMWVYEETLEDGRKLSEVINGTHENVKYLPGIKLPENVLAVTDVVEAAKDASILVFVVPHQFLERICNSLKGNLNPGVKAISLIKGMEVTEDGPVLLSSLIEKWLGVRTSVLMGANIATEVAKETFSEATIGSPNMDDGELFRSLFDLHYFKVTPVVDVPGVETSGALKNVVAIAAGIGDGLGYGGNTKAAIIRIGLSEMIAYTKHYFPKSEFGSFFESCGIADLVVTCYEGRNRRCGEAFAKNFPNKTFSQLETEVLKGQKLQGTITANDVHKSLEKQGITKNFPLFEAVYAIVFKGAHPTSLIPAISQNP